MFNRNVLDPHYRYTVPSQLTNSIILLVRDQIWINTHRLRPAQDEIKNRFMTVPDRSNLLSAII